MDLSVKFCGVKFKNPLVLASGILGVTGSSLKRAADNGAGGVTTKSIWLKPHVGHPNPVIIVNEHYMMNAVGLPDAGIEKAREELPGWIEKIKTPVIASVVAGTVKDFVETAEEVEKLGPALIELNISCPNVEDELGRPFACDENMAMEVTRKVKACVKKVPLIVKLSPNVAGVGSIANAVEAAGADAICMGNTAGPGMAIDINARQPILANKVGGISGPAIKPLMVRCVYEVFKAVEIPIIGLGGVTTGEDAIEMTMAGATLVGIGTGVHYRGVEVFGKVAEEMKGWMKKNGVKDLAEIRGVAHKV